MQNVVYESPAALSSISKGIADWVTKDRAKKPVQDTSGDVEMDMSV